MKYSWDLIQTFNAVATRGSLLAAARSLGMSQPTVGRQIGMLEAALNVTLFVRSRDGMALTEAGADLVDASTAMVHSAEAFSRRAAGLDADLAGAVRVSVNEVLGTYVLPTILRDFMEQNPEIEVEVDISNAAVNLSRRDADVALRMFRPTQNDLVGRKIADIRRGFFASKRYLDKYGRPDNFADLGRHRLIGFDRETIHIDTVRALGVTVSPQDFAFRSDTIVAQLEALKVGLGIGILHQRLAARMEGVEQVLKTADLPTVPLWIVCHTEVRYNRRIRLLVEFLADRLKALYVNRTNAQLEKLDDDSIPTNSADNKG
ncbi:MAG: LysR family transcriptional regulator [Alphaproteobacteria bacterium]|nr:LysR family transcriptional regulator [Alphaproteobacteria bacterium]